VNTEANLKPETRSQKAQERPNSEGRRPSPTVSWRRQKVHPLNAGDHLRTSELSLRPSFGPRSLAFGFRSAFSLIEIMVTVGLLTFIILGLLLMFNQTQRAFKTGMTQTDVLEAGRTTMDLLARELEQISPSEYPDYLSGGIRYRAANFFVEPSPGFSWIDPLLQELPGNSLPRTNLVQRFYFLSKLNQDWVSTGYEVWPEDGNGWVGSLYRFTATNSPRGYRLTNDIAFRNSLPANMSRVADGIVHLRVRAFANNGRLITTNYLTGTNAMYQVRLNGPYTNSPNALVYNSSSDVRQAACYFMSNALPAYLELELGLLEPQTLQKYRSIPVPLAARQYLSNHVA